MKSIKFFILAVFPFILIIPSCSKENELDLKSILTSQSWRLISDIDVLGAIPLWECDLDDCHRFNPDGTITFEKGSIDCPQSQSYDLGFYTWSLTENGRTITFDGTQSYDIDITEDKMFISCVFGSMTFISCSGNAYLKESQNRKEILMSHGWICESCEDSPIYYFDGCYTYKSDGTIAVDGKNTGFTWDWSAYGTEWFEHDPYDDYIAVIESISNNRIVFIFQDKQRYEPYRVTYISCE